MKWRWSPHWNITDGIIWMTRSCLPFIEMPWWDRQPFQRHRKACFANGRWAAWEGWMHLRRGRLTCRIPSTEHRQRLMRRFVLAIHQQVDNRALLTTKATFHHCGCTDGMRDGRKSVGICVRYPLLPVGIGPILVIVWDLWQAGYRFASWQRPVEYISAWIIGKWISPPRTSVGMY